MSLSIVTAAGGTVINGGAPSTAVLKATTTQAEPARKRRISDGIFLGVLPGMSLTSLGVLGQGSVRISFRDWWIGKGDVPRRDNGD